MPFTKKGLKIKQAMAEEYGKTRGERIFYASRNKGTITGVDMPGKLSKAKKRTTKARKSR
jgi:hypothetical protein